MEHVSFTPRAVAGFATGCRPWNRRGVGGGRAGQCGNGTVHHAPAPGYRGRDAFNHAVVIDDGRTAQATVTV